MTPLDIGDVVVDAFAGMSAFIAPVATAAIGLAFGFWGLPRLVSFFKSVAS